LTQTAATRLKEALEKEEDDIVRKEFNKAYV